MTTSVLDLSAFILGVAIGIMGVAIITATTITTFIIILTVILLIGTDIAIMAAVMAIMAVVRCRPFRSCHTPAPYAMKPVVPVRRGPCALTGFSSGHQFSGLYPAAFALA